MSGVDIQSDYGAVAICSRGLVHSRTMDSVLRELSRERLLGRWLIKIPDPKPIPAAQNDVVADILGNHNWCRWILFVEEDIVLPPKLFQHFDRSPIQAVNYTLPGGIDSIKYSARYQDRLLFCGLGCTLVDVRVLESFKPWFRTDRQYTEEDGRLVALGGNRVGYGGHDIDFCYQANAHDFGIKEVPGVRAQHLRVTEMGKTGQNDGVHQVVAL